MVIFIAIAAGQVASAHGNEVRQDGMTTRQQCPADKARLAQLKLKELSSSHFQSLIGNEGYATKALERKTPIW
ncbi:MAG: hypothetical protein ACREBC_17635, partial [Pyrinomonadaceae bacterium]